VDRGGQLPRRGRAGDGGRRRRDRDRGVGRHRLELLQLLAAALPLPLLRRRLENKPGVCRARQRRGVGARRQALARELEVCGGGRRLWRGIPRETRPGAGGRTPPVHLGRSPRTVEPQKIVAPGRGCRPIGRAVAAQRPGGRRRARGADVAAALARRGGHECTEKPARN
jgi:hypothetical protein